MKGYRKYFLNKLGWFIVTLVCAFILNFCLPRLMPGDPVAAIVSRLAQGMSDATGVQAIYQQYADLFGTNRPIYEQFFIYVKNVVRSDFGFSFSQYPRTVADVIASSIWWTVFLMAVILLVVFALTLGWFPTSGGYGFDMIPTLSWGFMWSVIVHYQLPFWSIVLITIGGQAIGMLSMAIYELNADYVKYSRFMGIKDRKILCYVFRNAMLPQVTGLALAIGTMVSGALVAEIIFSYPGLGSTILKAVLGQDYPLISAATLIITLMVLVTTFAIEILYGFIDPRVKAAQSDG
ncbi:MAG: ABC transporter permease [Gammaproteobacteria bacterium]